MVKNFLKNGDKDGSGSVPKGHFLSQGVPFPKPSEPDFEYTAGGSSGGSGTISLGDDSELDLDKPMLATLPKAATALPTDKARQAAAAALATVSTTGAASASADPKSGAPAAAAPAANSESVSFQPRFRASALCACRPSRLLLRPLVAMARPSQRRRDCVSTASLIIDFCRAKEKSDRFCLGLRLRSDFRRFLAIFDANFAF
mgnify:CR=1 FL=1